MECYSFELLYSRRCDATVLYIYIYMYIYMYAGFCCVRVQFTTNNNYRHTDTHKRLLLLLLPGI